MKTRQWGSFVSKYIIILLLIVMVIVFSIASPVFLSATNMMNILRQVAVVGIAAVGQTMLIIAGGIDLSLGSNIGLSGIICAQLMLSGVHPLIASLITLICGGVVGFLNGAAVNKFHMPAMIVTLGTQTIWRGVAYLLTDGLPVYGFDSSFTILGQGRVLGIPISVIVMFAAFVMGYLILNKFKIGRHIYGVGANPEASRLSGIRVQRVNYFVFTFAGVMYALAGLVLLSRTNSGQPKAGYGYEMNVITGVVLGGVSLAGGEGKILRVVIGVIFMGVLANGMIITGLGEYVQQVVQGLVLVLAVAFDVYNQRRAKQVLLDSAVTNTEEKD